MGMTRADKFEEIFGYRPATDQVVCNEHDYCGGSDACNYCMYHPNNIGCDEDWWNAEYKEPTIKNDLGVDAVSRQAVLDLIADYDLSMGQVVRGIHALPSVTPQEPFINKPCVSSGVCEHDKQKVLDKIREQIDTMIKDIDKIQVYLDCHEGFADEYISKTKLMRIVDKYCGTEINGETDNTK